MNKRTITILSLVAIVLLIAAFLGYGPAFATQLRSCQSSPSNCASTASGGVLIGFALYLLGALAALLAWIMGLVRTAQIGRWGWFLVVFLISPLGSLLYGLAGPTTRAHA
jgi:sugar phosphate permease